MTRSKLGLHDNLCRDSLLPPINDIHLPYQIVPHSAPSAARTPGLTAAVATRHPVMLALETEGVDARLEFKRHRELRHVTKLTAICVWSNTGDRRARCTEREGMLDSAAVGVDGMIPRA